MTLLVAQNAHPEVGMENWNVRGSRTIVTRESTRRPPRHLGDA